MVANKPARIAFDPATHLAGEEIAGQDFQSKTAPLSCVVKLAADLLADCCACTVDRADASRLCLEPVR
jgi:hypothetical protein